MAKIGEVRKVNIDELRPYERNARIHTEDQVEQIARSIKEFGFLNPILIDKEKNVIAGHGRIMAARKLGLIEVPCLYVENLTEDQRRAYILADNRLTELGGWDMTIVTEELKDLAFDGFDIDLTGFELNIEEPADIQEDEYNETVVGDPIVKRGDVWLLGEHRLLCGDATSATDMEKLMDGNIAEIAITSPPYNASSLNQKGKDGTGRKYIEYDDNKTEDEYFSFLRDNVALLLAYSKEVFYNIGLVEGSKRSIIRLQNEYIAQFKDVIYWKKSSVAPHIQQGIINNLVEFILCFGNGRRKFENAQFSQGTYWNVIEGNNASGNPYAAIHKATFPVYLPANIIENFCNKNSIVVDCFGGTGTTMIACEQLNRKCYMMELDPHYCDVIISRWEQFTGKKAVRVDG